MSVRSWVKRREHPLADAIWRTSRYIRTAQVPCIPSIHKPLYQIRLTALHLWHEVRRITWWTPLFQSRLVRPAKQLFVFSGVPQVLGALDIEFGERCTISGHTTLSGRSASAETPRLVVGDNCDIGWQVTISVGQKVILGNNVMIAAKCLLAGYAGHPQDPIRRAAHMPDDASQIGDIILEDDVWLATGVTVIAGVRIGAGSIIGAGSVVVRDVPPGVIAAGNPAKVLGPVRVDKPKVAGSL